MTEDGEVTDAEHPQHAVHPRSALGHHCRIARMHDGEAMMVELGLARVQPNLDGAKSLGQIVVGLPQQLVEAEIEIDTAGIARHSRIKSAEKIPERKARALCLEVP